jgi:hypothetical protein
MNSMSQRLNEKGGWSGLLILLAGLLLLIGVVYAGSDVRESAYLAAREPAMTAAPNGLSDSMPLSPQARGATETALFAAG